MIVVVLQLNGQVKDVFTDPHDGVDRLWSTSPNRDQITRKQLVQERRCGYEGLACKETC